MMLYLQVLGLGAFSVVMALAAFEDFRRHIIPNQLPILLCALWPLHLAGSTSLYGALGALACAAAVFVVGALLFARGWLGGGDVKLLSAAALWAGVAGTPALLVLTGALGGVLGLFMLMPVGNQLVTAARLMLGQTSLPEGRGLATPVPYGVAIAGAAVIVVLSPHIG